MLAPFFSALSQKRPAMAVEFPLGLGLANKHTIFIRIYPLDIKLRLDLVNLCCRQIQNFGNAGFSGYDFQIFLDIRHGRRNERKPDIERVIPLIIVGDTGKLIDQPGKIVDFVFRNAGRTECTDKPDLSRHDVAADPSNDTSIFKPDDAFDHRRFRQTQVFGNRQKRLRCHRKIRLDAIQNFCIFFIKLRHENKPPA